MRKAYNHAEHSWSETDTEFLNEPAQSTEIAEHFELVTRLTQASHNVTGRSGWFTREEEHELADRIQDGVTARGVITELGNLYDGRFEEILNDAAAARNDLVIANLPFAAYYARLSTGWTASKQDRTETPDIGSATSPYFGMVKAPGTYAPLSKFKHINASLEDRTQIAMEAMWKSSNNFTSDRSARFIAYAAWSIQQALGYAFNDDKNQGWSLTRTSDKTYADLLSSVEKPEEVYWPRHIQDNGKLRDGFHPLQVKEGRKGIHYEGVDLSRIYGIQPLDSDELQVTLADVTSSMDISQSGQTEYKEMLHTLDLVLDTLSEREQLIIRSRFGIDDGKPKTLDEIAEVLGRSRELVRNIETKTMSKLRHPHRSQLLQDYVGIEEVRDTDASGGRAVRGASWIKTTRTENAKWS